MCYNMAEAMILHFWEWVVKEPAASISLSLSLCVLPFLCLSFHSPSRNQLSYCEQSYRGAHREGNEASHHLSELATHLHSTTWVSLQLTSNSAKPPGACHLKGQFDQNLRRPRWRTRTTQLSCSQILNPQKPYGIISVCEYKLLYFGVTFCYVAVDN